MNGNPFYVQPAGADVGRNLAGLAQIVRERRARDAAEEARQAELARRAQVRQEVRDAYRSSDPARIAEVMAANPEVSQSLGAAMQFKNEATKNRMIADSRAIMANPGQTEQIIKRRLDFLRSQGADTTESETLLEAYRKDPETFAQQNEMLYAAYDPKGYQAAMMVKTGGPRAKVAPGTRILESGVVITVDSAGNQRVTDAAGQPVTGAARVAALREDRQMRQEEQVSVARRKADISVDAETRKAAARAGVELRNKPQIQAAVAKAVSDVKQGEKVAEEQRSNKAIWNTFKSAMDDFSRDLAATDTGPVSGMITLTAKQQVAESAPALLAPTLKSIFRQAGEGTFTDADQKLLLDMIPTRTDYPAARDRKIEKIINLVRDKLGIPGQEPPPGEVEQTRIEATTATEQPAAAPAPMQAGQSRQIGRFTVTRTQ